MATDDEFSFPTVDKIRSSSNSTTIDSPPLWRLSPAATSTDDDDDDDEEDHSAITTPVENYNQRKSFSGNESGLRIMGADDDQITINTTTTEEEEKMDMLWEDFNEELYPIRSTSTSDFNNYVSGEMLQLGCVGLGAFNLPKSTITTKPGVVVIVKVLKRLFFLHNSHHRSQPRR
ncbi:hypothetical protein M0R45_009054 [Rubus argutus]|uniref:Uncharacterized protein n=1 Tax=Rubus argutus TaxID=59490 RepID=A0AAW1Y3H0_RUBAR